jgi:hypothetical protein
MLGTTWNLVKESVFSFIADEALTRGAAIAFYTVTSIGPVLFIVVAIAGLVFGEDAARGAIAEQLDGLMGRQSADLLQVAIQNAATKTAGFLATAVGLSRANSSTCTNKASICGRKRRRNTAMVSWSGWSFAAMKRNATLSYVARSSLRLENTPVA